MPNLHMSFRRRRHGLKRGSGGTAGRRRGDGGRIRSKRPGWRSAGPLSPDSRPRPRKCTPKPRLVGIATFVKGISSRSRRSGDAAGGCRGSLRRWGRRGPGGCARPALAEGGVAEGAGRHEQRVLVEKDVWPRRELRRFEYFTPRRRCGRGRHHRCRRRRPRRSAAERGDWRDRLQSGVRRPRSGSATTSLACHQGAPDEETWRDRGASSPRSRTLTAAKFVPAGRRAVERRPRRYACARSSPRSWRRSSHRRGAAQIDASQAAGDPSPE